MGNIPVKEEWQQILEARHGKELQEKFSKATVAICGLGGLGSNIAVALARAGIGNLILIDYDRVDISNLHRQQYKATQVGMYKTEALAENLKEIFPYVLLQLHRVKITEENFQELLAEADIICEAFDEAEAKAMLVNGVLEMFPEKYLVAASGMAGLGPANDIRTRRVMKNFYLCGDWSVMWQEKWDLFLPESCYVRRIRHMWCYVFWRVCRMICNLRKRKQ